MDAAEKFDWIDANKKPAREMRGKLAYQYRREKFLSPGRSMIAASDYIAENIMIPPKSGQEFDAWLNATHSKSPNGCDSDIDSKYEVEIVNDLTPPSSTFPNHGGHDHIWESAWKVVREMPIDKWQAIRLADEKQALNCQTSVNTYSKKHLHCSENGWRLRSKIDKTQANVLWMIKVKL